MEKRKLEQFVVLLVSVAAIFIVLYFIGFGRLTGFVVFTTSSVPSTHEEVVSGGSTSSTTVVSSSITAVNDNLYIAAVSTKPNRDITNVDGLGLTWTHSQTSKSYAHRPL